MSKRTRGPARVSRGEARRVESLVKSNTRAAAAAGKRMRHGTARSEKAGCQCLKCRIYRAKLTGRPQDPHYPSHLRDGGL